MCLLRTDCEPGEGDWDEAVQIQTYDERSIFVTMLCAPMMMNTVEMCIQLTDITLMIVVKRKG